ncbi:metal ABC transporter solute-binding protein, Zn/Mn family [Salipaludibacillus daqingensis]|uniref:metal ABC transporter solute-binding protein, Zn/Mn family n=1 Tax=Salipaludibacillus daqingensis TaxID=3041001 RepID=UPI0024756F82|nr:zinc ABC transporter substrate-binding protein [Salipaludibacillus daqingensis]
MRNVRIDFLFLSFIFSILLMIGCEAEGGQGNENEGLYVKTSFSILADMTDQILGDRGTVEYIVPIGQGPEEYEPRPSNFQNVSDADVFYVNGMGLEEWLERVVSNASDTPIVELSHGVDPIQLVGEDGEDPHGWLSPRSGIIYIENILEDLISRDPEGKEEYQQRAEEYIEQLNEIDEWISEEVKKIEEHHRIIVVSENAYKYFGEDYGLQTEGIWELNSHDEGTTQQINRVIDVVKDNELPAVFVETTVDHRYMETISLNTDVPISGEVYTDAIGEEGSGADSYLKMLRHNAETFIDGLSTE